jgi:hypothetical protein
LYLIIFFDKPLKFNRKRLSHKLGYISGIFDNIFRWTSVSSQIYDHLCVWKFPLNSKLLGDKNCIHWIWPVKKDGSFSFYLSIAVLLVFLYLIAVYSFIISKILVYIFNFFFLTNPWNSIEKGCHTNWVTFLAFLTTYFDEHFCWKEINYTANSFYGSKKIESFAWEKNCNIWSSLVLPPSFF